MNKKLLAIAVGAAMVAGTTVAMAEATVYGKINMGIVSYDDGDKGGIVSGTTTSQEGKGIGIFDEASRLGVKGSEDLGNGLKGVFKMEGTVDMDGGGAFTFDRDTYVGLKGAFGEVLIGHKNTAYKNATGKMDLFSDMYGDMTGNGFGNFDSREDNMVQYNGDFGMVSVSADVNFSETTKESAAVPAVTTKDADKMGNSLAVTIKPMKGLMVSLAAATKGGGSSVNDSAQKLGVHWSGGDHTVNAVYKMQTDDSATTDDKMSVMYAQYAFAFGMSSIQLAYQMLDADGTDLNATQTSVAFIQKLSKATRVYVAYSSVANEDGVSYQGRLGSGVSNFNATEPGNSPSGLALAVEHNF
jgi:predicted porin